MRTKGEAARHATIWLAGAAIAACSPASVDDGTRPDASVAVDGASFAGDAASPAADAGIDDAGGADTATPAGDSGGSVADASTLVLTSGGFLQADGGGLLFAPSACGPTNESPPFTWTGVPASAQSLALTFVDQTNGATKWVVWDIPPTTLSLPADLPATPDPPAIPGASQLGSEGNAGYAGPGVPGPPYHTYAFVLCALDVATLTGTSGQSTAGIRTTLLPAHAIAMSAPLVAEGELDGP